MRRIWLGIAVVIAFAGICFASYAIDTLWQTELSCDSLLRVITLADGRQFVTAIQDSNLHVLSCDDGTLLWSLDISDAIDFGICDFNRDSTADFWKFRTGTVEVNGLESFFHIEIDIDTLWSDAFVIDMDTSNSIIAFRADLGNTHMDADSCLSYFAVISIDGDTLISQLYSLVYLPESQRYNTCEILTSLGAHDGIAAFFIRINWKSLMEVWLPANYTYFKYLSIDIRAMEFSIYTAFSFCNYDDMDEYHHCSRRNDQLVNLITNYLPDLSFVSHVDHYYYCSYEYATPPIYINEHYNIIREFGDDGATYLEDYPIAQKGKYLVAYSDTSYLFLDSLYCYFGSIELFSDSLPAQMLRFNYSVIQDGLIACSDTFIYSFRIIGKQIAQGWNLLSVPFNDTLALEDLFPFYIYPAWAWDNESKAYNIIYSVTSGEAFYLFSPLDTVIAINGTRETTNITDTLYRGWNLIGAPSVAVNCSVITDLPDVISEIFGFDAESQNYNIADFIRPGSGYWLFTTDTLELEIP